MSTRDTLLVLLVCTVWGFNFVAGAKGMQAFTPMLFMVLRFLVVLCLTLPFLARPPDGQWPRLAAACIFIGGFHFTLMFWALRVSSDVTSIAILQNTYIPMAVLLAIPLLGEHAGWRTLLATGVAFCGVLLIGFDPLVLAQPLAFALILGSALMQALGSVLMRGLRGISPMNFQAWTAILCLPLLLAATGLFEQGQWEAIRSAGTLHWGALLYSAVLASLVGHGLMFFLVQRNPVPEVMPWLLLMPVLATVFGVLVWGDRPGWRLLAGGALVLLGILAITLRGRQRALQRRDTVTP